MSEGGTGMVEGGSVRLPGFHGRTPTPPAEVAAWMERFAGEGADAGEALVEGTLTALGETLARPGRSREAAFALLAADGLLTYAVEDAARARDPEGALRGILERVSVSG